MSDKLGFELKTIVFTEGHNINIKGFIQQEYLTIVNMVCYQHGSSQLHNQLLTKRKRHTDNNMLTGGDLSPQLSNRQVIDAENQ